METSRWPISRGRRTLVPDLYRVEPPEVSNTVARGSIPALLNFQASSAVSERRMAAGGVASSKLPTSETPAVPVLKPPAWAPMTLRVTPP